MAYLEKVQGAWETFLFRFKKDCETSTFKKYACQRVERTSTVFESLNVPLFRSCEHNPLRNAFVVDPRQLPPPTVEALLGFYQSGMEWMMAYVGQNILMSLSMRRNISSLHSWRSPLLLGSSNLFKIRSSPLKNVARFFQAGRKGPLRVHSYPLAIADINGCMRASFKSEILQVLQSRLGDTFTEQYTFPECDKLCVTIDFLYFLHKPPPAQVNTFAHYCTYL